MQSILLTREDEEVDELLETLRRARRHAQEFGERAELLRYLLDMASLEAEAMAVERATNTSERRRRN
jgi:hypothetical protein